MSHVVDVSTFVPQGVHDAVSRLEASIEELERAAERCEETCVTILGNGGAARLKEIMGL